MDKRKSGGFFKRETARYGLAKGCLVPKNSCMGTVAQRADLIPQIELLHIFTALADDSTGLKSQKIVGNLAHRDHHISEAITCQFNSSNSMKIENLLQACGFDLYIQLVITNSGRGRIIAFEAQRIQHALRSDGQLLRSLRFFQGNHIYGLFPVLK